MKASAQTAATRTARPAAVMTAMAAQKRRGLRARLLAIPLFYKILVANAGIVLLFSLMATWLAVRWAATRKTPPACSMTR